jgi:T-complex protein 11
MLGTNQPGGLPSRECGNNIAAAKEYSGVKAKEEQEELGSTDRASAGHLDETSDHRDTEHVDGIQDLPAREARYGCNPSSQPLATAQSGNPSQATINSGASAEGRVMAGAKRIKTSSLEPPVTRSTLSELDVPRIVFNPKLRHDVNFDPDLHFRPNLDGEKGRRKAQKATEFWNCFRSQLQAFMEDKVTFETQHTGQTWCLPTTLIAIGEILGTLVPPEDRSVVEEILNVDLLMQQFSRGVADLEKLAVWLSQTLKTHCAPMRDEWVDEMVNQLSNGNRNRDVPVLVQGLQTLLGVLEAMKLVQTLGYYE